MVLRAKLVDGKKFMWDGCAYATPEDAKSAADAYGKSGFETTVTQEQNQHLVFTRRVVKETVVQGQATH